MHSSGLGVLPAFIVLYATLYAAFGIASPFWPRFFEWRGLTAAQLGLLLGLGTIIRLIAGPFVGRIADLLGTLRAAFAICAACAASVALTLFIAKGFWPLLVIHMVQSATLAPTTTLADALALNAATRRANGFEYGWVRGSASVAFIAGTLVAGQVLSSAVLSSFVWMHAAMLACAAVATGLIPGLELGSPQAANDKVSVIGGVRRLFGMVLFRRVVLVAALVSGSHAMHDTFAVIRWNTAGLSFMPISILWSVSVVAEVLVFFWIGLAFINRFGPSRAAVIAALAGIVRWAVMSQTTALAALALVQPLHGLTFALLHLACMRLIAVIAPPHLAATAQSLYAFGAGLATALTMLTSGYLYGQFGAQAFLLMAVLCGVALPLAFRLRADDSSRKEASGSV